MKCDNYWRCPELCWTLGCRVLLSALQVCAIVDWFTLLFLLHLLFHYSACCSDALPLCLLLLLRLRQPDFLRSQPSKPPLLLAVGFSFFLLGVKPSCLRAVSSSCSPSSSARRHELGRQPRVDDGGEWVPSVPSVNARLELDGIDAISGMVWKPIGFMGVRSLPSASILPSDSS